MWRGKNATLIKMCFENKKKMQLACSSCDPFIVISVILQLNQFLWFTTTSFPFQWHYFVRLFSLLNIFCHLLMKLRPAARITTTRLEILHFNSTIFCCQQQHQQAFMLIPRGSGLVSSFMYSTVKHLHTKRSFQHVRANRSSNKTIARFRRMWKTLFRSVARSNRTPLADWNPFFFFNTRIYRNTQQRVCSQFPSWFMIMIIGQVSIIMAENNMPVFGRKYPISTHSRSYSPIRLAVYVLTSLQVQHNHYLQLCWFTVAASETCACR